MTSAEPFNLPLLVMTRWSLLAALVTLPFRCAQAADVDASTPRSGQPASLPFRFDLRPAPKAEEVSEGSFLVGWVNVSSPQDVSLHQSLPVTMHEPYDHWVQWGLEKRDVNFDGYLDIAVREHGGAKWGRLYWWLYDPRDQTFYTNSLTAELSRLTHASLRADPKTRRILRTHFIGADLHEYSYRIADGNLRLATLESYKLLETTIPQLQQAIASGVLTSRELVELYLARIEAYDRQGPKLNAISVVNHQALTEAQTLDAERKARGPRGPLHGIPVIIKDNYATVGLQTAAGSKTLAGWIPPEDAFLVRRLRDAGAIVLAKSNMDEFAIGTTTRGSLFGQTLNPYDLSRNPGGSSGGTGAAIAANFAAVGMGSDTCGSIRIPAAHNSLVGLRGTQGLLSRAGIIPMSHTQDIGGPLARSVTDLAIVLDAIVGYDPADPQTAASVGNIPKSYRSFLKADGLVGARIGLLTDLLGTEPAETEVSEIVKRAMTEIEGEGAEVIAVSIPDLKGLLSDRMRGFLVLSHEFKFDLNAYLAAHPSAPVRSLEEILASGKCHPDIESLDSKEYLEHLVKRDVLRQAIFKTMAEHQLKVLAYPTMRHAALALGESQAADNSRLSANSGLPAITVPAGFTADGLPVGVELLGRAWSEPLLLKLAYAYEQATSHRQPPATTPALP